MTSLLYLNQVSVGFPNTVKGNTQWMKAVDHISLSIESGEILGVVGESGCGKSLSSLAVLNLVPSPGKILSGDIVFDGQSLLSLSDEAMRRIRGKDIAFIPQDPMTSLNPVYTIGNQLTEVIRLHQGVSESEARRIAVEALEQVRLPDAKVRLDQYPHEFSGGMRQRVLIAMALSCKPKLLIADEPTTALDVTVQAQILDVIRDIQREHDMGVMLITHDMGVVAETCHRVAVMYAGRIVEQAPVDELFARPHHPYTQGLLAAIPSMTDRKPLLPIEGQPPAVGEIPDCCAFAPRCPKVFDTCTTIIPTSREITPHHESACLL